MNGLPGWAALPESPVRTPRDPSPNSQILPQNFPRNSCSIPKNFLNLPQKSFPWALPGTPEISFFPPFGIPLEFPGSRPKFLDPSQNSWISSLKISGPFPEIPGFGPQNCRASPLPTPGTPALFPPSWEEFGGSQIPLEFPGPLPKIPKSFPEFPNPLTKIPGTPP